MDNQRIGELFNYILFEKYCLIYNISNEDIAGCFWKNENSVTDNCKIVGFC